MKHILIAIDSFKGSLSSPQAGEAAADGIRRVFPEAICEIRPLADGGEGTVEALTAGTRGQLCTVTVSGPRRAPIRAQYGILPDGTAVMEMAAAAGLPLLSPSERNPAHTTTYGVGEMILDAISRGCREFILGIGGSATNDGGVGMLSALGWRFLDRAGNPIPDGTEGLARLSRIDADQVCPTLSSCRFYVACDVNNPLCGPLGATAVYGPQKGAHAEDIPTMDDALAAYARRTALLFPHADPNLPGSGAAGGLGFALRTYLGACLMPGVELILTRTGMEEAIARADLVITGEGRLDRQTAMGKAPAGVAALAKRHGKPVIAFAGCLGDGAQACNDCGIDAFFPILPACMTAEQAMEHTAAYRHLANTAEQAFRLIRAAVCEKNHENLLTGAEKKGTII